MTKVAKPFEDHEVEFVDEDDSSIDETKKAVGGFTPTQKVSWPFGAAQPPKERRLRRALVVRSGR